MASHSAERLEQRWAAPMVAHSVELTVVVRAASMAQYSVARRVGYLVVRMEQKWAVAKEHHLAARSAGMKDDDSVARWVDWKAALTVGHSAACSVKCWAE